MAPVRKSERLSRRKDKENDAVTKKTKSPEKRKTKAAMVEISNNAPSSNLTHLAGQNLSAPSLKTAEVSLNGSAVPDRTGTHYPGCHVSAAGGVDNSVKNALEIGAKSFALFLRNQRSWNAKPLDEKVAENFRRLCCENQIPPHLIIPHGSYLVNLGSPNEDTR